MKLLEDLEALNLIRVIKTETDQPKQKLPEKYLGKLPLKVADDLQNYITQSRKEWDSSST